MPKYNLLIDTNIYRKCPGRDDLAFKALERLCKEGVLKLYLPYVVEREFQTQQIDVYKKEFDLVSKGIDGLLRKKQAPKQMRQIETIKTKLDAIKEPTLAQVNAALPKWIESIGGSKLPLTKKDAQAAMEAYFLGKPPLTVAKEREDIPDAFIFQNISQLARNHVPLVVIAEDGKVFNASAALDGVRAYKSLAEFIELPDIQDEILELDVVDNLSALRVAFKNQESESGEVAYLMEHHVGQKLYGRTVHSRTIPDDNNEGTITSYWHPTDLALDYDELHYFGNGEFGLPFKFDMTVSITYYIFKSDFYLMDEEKMPSVSDHNDHYFEAESEIDIHVEGLVKLSIDPALVKEVSAEVIEENLEASIDSIDNVTVIE
ncbi:PIN domain-containing protein [Ferribacterium limneticum]|uniref:PIN domain-containing protein n=1 Tax=Ferribacterium limneticum TaxID=76259 RepID=UPI001CFA746B|nr:PIN domain-containing protein [Ferribacterium limneticum]UCV19537.1 DUF4935 domain-containing protein [Ferribacterium limneticum]